MIHIKLSRRNVEALLHMLDNRDKVQPAIIKGQYIIEVEENDVHYGDREPGVMSWEES